MVNNVLAISGDEFRIAQPVRTATLLVWCGPVGVSKYLLADDRETQQADPWINTV
jgi:hypothetical protein